MKEWEKLIQLLEKYGCDPAYVAECVLIHPEEDDEDFEEELFRFMD